MIALEDVVHAVVLAATLTSIPSTSEPPDSSINPSSSSSVLVELSVDPSVFPKSQTASTSSLDLVDPTTTTVSPFSSKFIFE